VFVNVTVPEVIERQQGTVTRHLKKARESFEIDNTKLLQREQDIIDNFAAHVKDAVRMQVRLFSSSCSLKSSSC
jgi:hypothetical protein